MPLTVVAFGSIVALGFGMWILGSLFGYLGVATIGGVIVIAAGGMVVEDGLGVKTGEVQVEDPTTNTTTIDFQYDRIDEVDQFQLGPITVLAGGLVIIHSLREEGGV